MTDEEFFHFDTRLEDVERWRNRAEEMRIIAEEMISEPNKAVALKLAADYGRLADLAEERVRYKDSKRSR
jgi:hypothetical protein